MVFLGGPQGIAKYNLMQNENRTDNALLSGMMQKACVCSGSSKVTYIHAAMCYICFACNNNHYDCNNTITVIMIGIAGNNTDVAIDDQRQPQDQVYLFCAIACNPWLLVCAAH